MGKLARLNNAGLLKNKAKTFIVVVKNDYSYEHKETVEGKEVVKKVENIVYVPLGRSNSYVSTFRSEEEANEFLKELANGNIDEKRLNYLLSQKFFMLEVRHAPLKKGILKKDWISNYVIKETALDIKKKRSSKLV